MGKEKIKKKKKDKYNIVQPAVESVIHFFLYLILLMVSAALILIIAYLLEVFGLI